MRRAQRVLAAAALTTLAVGSSLSLSAGSVSASDHEVIEGIIDATGPSSGSVPEPTVPTETLVTAVPLPVDPPPVAEEPEAPSTITAINGPAAVSTATTTTTTTIPEPQTVARNTVGGTVFVDFNRNGASRPALLVWINTSSCTVCMDATSRSTVPKPKL